MLFRMSFTVSNMVAALGTPKKRPNLEETWKIPHNIPNIGNGLVQLIRVGKYIQLNGLRKRFRFLLVISVLRWIITKTSKIANFQKLFKHWRRIWWKPESPGKGALIFISTSLTLHAGKSSKTIYSLLFFSFFKINFFKNFFQEYHHSFKQFWIQIRTDVLSVLFCVQTFAKFICRLTLASKKI